LHAYRDPPSRPPIAEATLAGNPCVPGAVRSTPRDPSDPVAAAVAIELKFPDVSPPSSKPGADGFE